MHSLLAFVGVAVIVTLTPGPATALVVRNALTGGPGAAFFTTLGNSAGVLFWGAASAAGISALIAASEIAFLALKVSGAAVLIALGVRAWHHQGDDVEARPSSHAFRDGVVTSFANPKLAIFFIALFPQFLSAGHSTLLQGLAMACVIVVLDLIWYPTLAFLVTRARQTFVSTSWASRLERLTGSIMIGLGLRLALEAR
jgi:threonine/homoserine/homoserine lactone efflux protein